MRLEAKEMNETFTERYIYSESLIVQFNVQFLQFF